MKLNDYLQREKIRPSVWAVKFGLAPSIICQYLRGKRGISSKTIKRIIEATQGEVAFEDLV